MYTKKTYYLKNIIQVEKGFSVRRGNHNSHNRKQNPTPEQMKIYNENVAARKLNRKIAANFGPGDYHVVLTYARDKRLTEEDSRKELRKFLNNLKRDYQKAGEELKYIITTEWRHSAVHHHLIINHIRGSTEMIRKRWNRGRPRFTPLDDTGEYIKLAEYFIKETKNEKLNGREKGKQSYSCSRNLIIPKPKVERIKAKDFIDEPKPIKGYYVMKDSVVNGVSPFGFKYQYYTMAKKPGVLANTNAPGDRRKNE